MPRLSALLVVIGTAVSAHAQAVVEIKHEGAVDCLAWSADGKRLALGGEMGVVRIVEHPSGKEITQFKVGAFVNGLVFSRDGKLLGVKSDGMDGPVSVWDIATQKKQRQLAFKGYSCNQLAFTADGDTLVAAAPGEQMIWNHVKGGGSGSKMGKVPDGSSAAAAPDGTLVGWCSPDGAVSFFATDTRKHQRMTMGPTVAFAFAPDGRFIASSNPDKTIRLWAIGGAEVRKFEGLREPAKLLHFSSNGKVLAAAAPSDAVVRLWDVNTGRLRRRVTVGPSGARTLALSPDGLTLALAIGGRVQLWNVATRELGDLGDAKALAMPEMKAAWEELASADPEKAEGAFRRLAATQQHGLDFLKQSIRTVAIPPLDREKAAQWVIDLESPVYAVRERAALELGKLGELVQPALEKFLAGKPTLEGERRARKLLSRLLDPELTPDRLRCLEGIEILEILRTPQAVAILEDLSRESLLNQIRVAAREAFERVRREDKDKSEGK